MIIKKYAAISADIVASTSLSREALIRLTGGLKALLDRAARDYQGFWGRLVKGDTIESVMARPGDALRVALLLKSYIKSFAPTNGIADAKFKQFGLRLAIGIGEMRIIDKSLDMMDGEAIYLSGRALSDMRDKTSDSFQIVMADDVSHGALAVVLSLLNQLINRATRRQCETLYIRLLSKDDAETAKKMGISRPGVNQNLRNMGWDAIERSLKYFEQLNFEGE